MINGVKCHDFHWISTIFSPFDVDAKGVWKWKSAAMSLPSGWKHHRKQQPQWAWWIGLRHAACKCHLRKGKPTWLDGHVAADIKFPKMLEVHPLGILLNYKCSCQWNYLLNGWPYIGSVFCVFGLFSITLKTEHWLLVWQILKRLQLWPQRMRRRIPNRAPMSAFIAESFKATCFDV